jgi:hypothetical protein
MFDIGHEPHVEHPVGLVEHKYFYMSEVEGAPSQVIEEPSRSGDDDVHAAAQFADLWPHRATPP